MATVVGNKPCGLYRLFSAVDRLVYVGIGEVPEVRWKQHSYTKSWWSEVDPTKTTVTWFNSRDEAAAAEVVAIKTEKPLYNVQHNYDGELDADRHANPKLTVRAPEQLRQAILDPLKQRGLTAQDFMIACLAALVADPDRQIEAVAPHWPEPKPKGRPRKKVDE